MNRIMDNFQKVKYLHRVAVALGGASEESQFREAKENFERLRTDNRNLKVVWVEGPRIQKIFQEI